MSKLLATHLSTSVVHFKPGQVPPTFDVKVSNHSDDFATFQLEVLAAGVAAGADTHWYRQAPDLSAKIPPGDRTQFSIAILDVPPVPGGFVGAMTLTVRVFSVELRQEDRQVLNLVIEGSGIMPPRLELLLLTLTAQPLQALEIPVRLYNPNRSPLRVSLSLQGLPVEWLSDGYERRLEVPPLGETEAVFLGQLGAPIATPSQIYPFTLVAQSGHGVGTQLRSQLTVLPTGHLGFDLVTPVVMYPPSPVTQLPDPLPAPQSPALTVPEPTIPLPTTAHITLQWRNQSNLPQVITPVVQRVSVEFMGDGIEEVVPMRSRDRITLPERPLDLPIGADLPIVLPIAVQRAWLGWVRTQRFQITALRADEQIPLQPERHTVMVRVRPRVSIWLQLAAVALLTGMALLGVLKSAGHRSTVNTVRFDGRASEVLSASEDQTVRRWSISGRRLRLLQRSVQADKAVRVARYRPVGNDAVAVGYENGAVEIISLRVRQPPLVLQHPLDDRVFDLQFAPDAQSLFTAYGSGEVRRWDLSGLPSGVLQPVQTETVGFAVQALALVGTPMAQVAVGGRFNRLTLWNWQQQTLTQIPYSSKGGDQDYITSLATTDRLPERLAVADNQGRISLWDLRPCLTGGVCRPLDDWLDGHGGQPVKAIALSDDGCYLVSGGDDGQTMLWELRADGEMVQGQKLGRSRQAITAVDVTRRGDRLAVVSGGNDHRVRLYTVAKPLSCQP
ncbi:WD40 repeat domain-containing protein [Nodosilinea sp. E11]|uniref:WD40 repeat domain-containing protein n=1 Tax=Nodosilinea sp. E11 TaxID=3037479 RepID=UPI002934EC62|nr:WD40 repeat domain-containing protein [Nodosilinea sp. E11]WOD37094.1 WD40 repeat domain-containing protein [Nodosilinea sp. E11]